MIHENGRVWGGKALHFEGYAYSKIRDAFFLEMPAAQEWRLS